MSIEISQRRKSRPVNLNLMTFRYPVTAIASILHRLSGVILFLSIPFLLWVLDFSLSSPDNFASIQIFLTHPTIKFILWFLLTALIYHFFAGLRHIVMDFGWGESLTVGKMTASITILLTVVFAITLGIYLW